MAALAAACGFLLGIPLISQQGNDLINLLDNFSEAASLIIAFFEVLALCWVYGAGSLRDHAQMMEGGGKGAKNYYLLTWYLAPVLMGSVACWTLSQWDFRSPKFPAWSQKMGWTIVAIVVSPIPLWAVGFTAKKAIWDREWKQLLSPHPKWGPAKHKRKTAAAAPDDDPEKTAVATGESCEICRRQFETGGLFDASFRECRDIQLRDFNQVSFDAVD